MFPNDGVIVDSAKAFAAVPDAVGKTITSFSKISENLSCNSFEIWSFPYGVLSPSFALIIASRTSGHAPATLSEANFTRSLFVLILAILLFWKIIF